MFYITSTLPVSMTRASSGCTGVGGRGIAAGRGGARGLLVPLEYKIIIQWA